MEFQFFCIRISGYRNKYCNFRPLRGLKTLLRAEIQEIKKIIPRVKCHQYKPYNPVAYFTLSKIHGFNRGFIVPSTTRSALQLKTPPLSMI